MATLSQAAKEDLAKRVTVASTWVQGPRRVELLAIADEILGVGQDDDSPDEDQEPDRHGEMAPWQDQDPAT